ncbi:nucleotide sugar dehydrogenase [Priestia flexa]|uniref:nucleotide sugar dehydrogenase n=1 Tax=Priestia flexa TaxID=86664 RepID=UPI0024BF5394|nr:nucleotide sugar dehydrogenase [Priestia flexa]WHX77827.1 nucleotide sugar dehydrogenase [Priestia flexa]
MMKTKKVAVLGLGYVGLPLALLVAKKSFDVIGLDVDRSKVNLLHQGKSYIPDVSNEEIKREKKFKAQCLQDGIEEFKQCEYVIVTVPTPINDQHEPDLTAMIKASEFLQKEMVAGQTVIYESSTYPGTLEEIVLPILLKSKLQVGIDFYLAYSPERVDPANTHYHIEQIPKVISGYTESCLQKISEFYGSIFQKVVPVSSPNVAEMCKLFENIQRLVNISLVNETNVLCEQLNIDFYEVLEAAATKPFGFTPYYPGPGIGGHCIPVDPLYFVWKLKQAGLKSELIQAAHEINEQMTEHVVTLVEKQLDKNKKNVLVIGIAYKRDVNDVRESPALPICNQLITRGYNLSYHDPYIDTFTLNGCNIQSVELTKQAVQTANVVLILTDHQNIDWSLVKTAAKIVDTRGVLRR